MASHPEDHGSCKRELEPEHARGHLPLTEYSDNPANLKFDAATYKDFRDRRRAKMFQILKKAVDLTQDQPTQANAATIDD